MEGTRRDGRSRAHRDRRLRRSSLRHRRGYRKLDWDRVLVLHRAIGRFKGSRLEVGKLRSESAHVFHIRGGKVIKLVLYSATASARSSASLAACASRPCRRLLRNARKPVKRPASFGATQTVRAVSVAMCATSAACGVDRLSAGLPEAGGRAQRSRGRPGSSSRTVRVMAPWQVARCPQPRTVASGLARP